MKCKFMGAVWLWTIAISFFGSIATVYCTVWGLFTVDYGFKLLATAVTTGIFGIIMLMAHLVMNGDYYGA